MVPNDPGGIAWSDWKAAGYDSYETFIEAKAGACPPEMDGGWGWPMPKPPPYPADDEAREVPDE